MPDNQMVIRIAANLDELRANLLEGKASIEALGPSVDQLTTKWTERSTTLIQNAQNITAAIDKMGVSTMTAGDQSKSLKTLDAAMAQLRQTGEPVPQMMADTAARLQSMAPASAQAASSLDTITRAAAALGITLSARELLMGIESIITFGEETERAAIKTGMTTAEVQKLGYIAQQTGTETIVMTNAVQLLEQRLGTENSGAAGAMARLGINTEAFLALDPYQEMQTLAAAMGQVPDPTERAALAFQLFGKAWKEVMPAMLSDFNALADAAPQMSEAQIKAMAAMSHAWGGFKTEVQVDTANAYDAMVEFVARLAIASDSVRSPMEKLGALIYGLHDAFIELPPVVAPVGVATAGVALSMDDAAKAAKQLAADLAAENAVNGDAYKRMAELTKIMTNLQSVGVDWRATVAGISVETAASVQHYLAAGIAQTDLATAFHLTAAQVKALATEMQEQSKAQAELAKVTIEWQKTVEASSHDTVGRMIADAYLAADAKIAAEKKAGDYSLATEAMIRAAADQTAQNIIQRTLESDRYTREHYQLIADQAQIAFDFALAHLSSYTAEEIRQLGEAARVAAQTSNHWMQAAEADMDAVGAAAGRTAHAVDGIGEAAKKAADAMARMAQGSTVEYDLSTNFGRAQVEEMNPGISKYLSQGYSLQQAMQLRLAELYHFQATVGAPDNPKPPAGTYPGYAAGGAVHADAPIIVGERGPELFVPPSAGYIVPNGGGSGVGATSITIAPGAVVINYPLMNDPRARLELATMVGNALIAKMKSQGWRVPAGV